MKEIPKLCREKVSPLPGLKPRASDIPRLKRLGVPSRFHEGKKGGGTISDSTNTRATQLVILGNKGKCGCLRLALARRFDPSGME